MMNTHPNSRLHRNYIVMNYLHRYAVLSTFRGSTDNENLVFTLRFLNTLVT